MQEKPNPEQPEHRCFDAGGRDRARADGSGRHRVLPQQAEGSAAEEGLAATSVSRRKAKWHSKLALRASSAPRIDAGDRHLGKPSDESEHATEDGAEPADGERAEERPHYGEREELGCGFDPPAATGAHAGSSEEQSERERDRDRCRHTPADGDAEENPARDERDVRHEGDRDA